MQSLFSSLFLYAPPPPPKRSSENAPLILLSSSPSPLPVFSFSFNELSSFLGVSVSRPDYHAVGDFSPLVSLSLFLKGT